MVLLVVISIPIDADPCTLVPVEMGIKLVVGIGTGQVILLLWGMGTGTGEMRGKIETGAR